MKKVPTPEELAEENRRTEEAAAAAGKVLTVEQVKAGPPRPTPAFDAAVDVWRQYEDHGELLRQQRWVPSTPAEFAAALWALAGDIDCVWDRHSVPSIPTLEEHILAIESVITGQTVEWMANLDEDPIGSGPTRIPFQVLYQQFEAKRLAGENAGLHQRIQELERRLALLEARMTTSPEWSPEPGNEAEEGLLEALRLGDGEVDWSPDEEPTGDALHDLDTGALRPQTWPQLLRCLQVLANHVNYLVNDHIDAEVDRDGVLRAVALLIESAGIHRSAGVR